MPRFAANLSLMFTELPFLDRFEAAAAAGFKGVEFLFPYDFDAREIKARLEANGLEQVLFNLWAGDWAAGDRGIAIYPDKVEKFRETVALALQYAEALGCTQLHCLAGVVPVATNTDALHETYLENLRFAAEAASSAGVTILIEAINTRDIPGYFLTSTAASAHIVEILGSSNLKMQYDVYHMQIMEGDLTPTIDAHLPKIAHIQIADTPGRNEPGTGEINFPYIFAHLDSVGYQGWVGCEYKPRTSTQESLAWFHALTPKA